VALGTCRTCRGPAGGPGAAGPLSSPRRLQRATTPARTFWGTARPVRRAARFG
jgi:hypothetical protein